MTGRHLLLSLVGGTIAALIFLVALGRLGIRQTPETDIVPSTPASLSSERAVLPPPSPVVSQEVLLLTRDDDKDGHWDAVLVVDNGRMREMTLPKDTDRTTTPVTDGQRLYTYREVFKGGTHERRLVAIDLRGGTEIIVTGGTSLVTPRQVFASPTGNVIAFYLDNVRDHLTELWTFDPHVGKRRLAVERVTTQVRGPFWAADGGFLLLDDHRVLRGSPHRTGADLLPIERSWNDLLPGPSSLLPSPGGSQAIFVVRPRERSGEDALEVHVWDLPKAEERTVISLPSAEVRLLGWTADGALVASAAENDGLTLWSLRKDAQEPQALGHGASSAVLSSDGAAFAYLRREENEVAVVVTDLHGGMLHPILSLPSNRADAPEKQSSISYTLHQFIHRGTGREAIVQGATDLASEEIVRYVMEHIREMSDAAATEPVTAERVWGTQFPSVVLIDYRVGTTLWRRSVQIVSVGGRPVRHTVLGVYAPAAGEWILTRGVDLPGEATMLYEFEADLGKWVRKEIPRGIQP